MFTWKFAKAEPSLVRHIFQHLRRRRNWKKSLLNIKNVYDDFCLLYCVAAALFPVTHNRSRSSNYSSRLPELIFDPNNMPIKIEHIPKFEHDNSLSITLFHYREYGILTTCFWRKRRESVRKKINLVLLTNAETSHYCLITNFQNFMHKMCRSYKKNAKGNKTTFCASCMQSMLKKNWKITLECVPRIHLYELKCPLRKRN